MELRPTLSFFAQILQTDKELLDFTLIKRKDNGERRPAITVEGLRYVFDINDCRFVKIGKEVNVLRTTIVKNDNCIIFLDPNGCRMEYTQDDFLKVYSKRVVNDSLY